MTGVIEAAGEMGTAAAWARVAEPGAGETHGEGHDGTCLNCGTALVGRYCHACGQSGHVHRTLMSIVHDLAHGVFHFEGKIWRTVPMLVFHPGQLTRRYIAGERARFVSPLALFLFTVFLMFATYSAVGPGDLTKGLADGWSKSNVALDQARGETAKDLAAAAQERARLVSAGRATAKVDQRLAKLKEDEAALAKVRYRLNAGSETVQVTSHWQWMDKRLQEARDNPGLVLYKVQSAAYKFSWALIFLSTPFVALVFLWKRRFGLYDHAIFVTYSISFMSLLAIVLELLLTIDTPGWLFGCLIAFALPIHLFAQLRGAYSLSVFSALWRTVFLLFVALNTLVTFVIGVIALEIAR